MSVIPVEEIKESANLVDYISNFYPEQKLKSYGNTYSCLCPFHSEKTPSFTVFNNGSYKCFGCGEHGDIIEFVKKKERLDFKEACQLIAENVGVDYTLKPANPHVEKYKEDMEKHAKRYHKNLLEDKEALSYLESNRGLKKETIKKFNLGLTFADEYKYRKDIGGISNRFSFPILENRGEDNSKCIAMGYRAREDESPKYINDTNKDGRDGQDPKIKGVFNKSKSLYAFNLAKKNIRKRGYAIIVEGYLDAIALHQSGLTNAVAVMGTGFTEAQMDILRKVTENLVLFFDGDKAGKRSVYKAIPKLYEKGFSVVDVQMPIGNDPADICKELDFHSKLVTHFVTDNSEPAMKVVIDNILKDYERTLTRERLKAVKKINPLLETISDNAEKDVFKSIAYKTLGML